MKKILIMISCIAMIFTTLLLTDNNSVFAANIDDTFTEGDLSYKVIDLGNPTTNGKVMITDFDETSQVTTLTIPNTVEKDGKTFDVVSASRSAFEGANNVKNLNIPENFTYISTESFVKFNDENFTVESALETIVVDENNPVLKVIDGVLYNVKSGEEELLLYPYNSSKKEYVVPDLLINSTFDSLFSVMSYARHFESIVMPFESKDGDFTENGMFCRWIDKNDHSQGSEVLAIPQAMKKVVISENVVDVDWILKNGPYYMLNKATEFVVAEGNRRYQSIDGCLYEGDTLLLYPGGLNDLVYKIPKAEGTKAIGQAAFFGNRNLKSLIIPASVNSIADYAFAPFSLKSIKIEGNTNITWGDDSFTDMDGNNLYYHIYVDNGNTAIKQQLQQKFIHLTDSYFHEVGAVPTTNISNVKTSIENKKDVKVSWNASTTSDGYEVRRYDHNGTYEVVASTANTSYVDTTTAYNMPYQYEIVPYNLPVTSSNDIEDPLRTYKTVGTASQKVSITTPIQKFQGTYVYKDADGSEVTITKEIKANTSALQQAPTLPEVKGYEFEKWTTDLTNSENVDKDFIATAIYKKKGLTPDIENPEEEPGDNPEIKPNDPISPEIKPENKPSEIEPAPNFPSDDVKTGDWNNPTVIIVLLIMSGVVLLALRKKYVEE